jgi:hypothetical protein
LEAISLHSFVCFVFIAISGAVWQMLEAKDAAK